jgi:DNA modification methylase
MGATLYCGDVRDVLARLDAESIQCVVTSPPYFGLRDYGVLGQLGLEKAPDEYVAAMVEVFRAVRRVLRDDGVLWLNLGDSYAGSWGAQGRQGATGQMADRSVVSARQIEAHPKRMSRTGRDAPGAAYKAKDLLGIPWMVAFALRADGWYLRSDIIWAKPNPMPESVTDRPTKSHEYLFLFTKSERYYYDAVAIAEPQAEASEARYGYAFGCSKSEALVEANKTGIGQRTRPVGEREYRGTRNARTVWTIATQPYTGAHFATFPEELARRCILAGSSAKACESCGAPWERVTEHTKGDTEAHERPKRTAGMLSTTSTLSLSGNGSKEWTERGGRRETVGWQPTCACPANTGTGQSVVLDCFGGSGTVASVATGHGRRAVHIDLNPAYIELARQRIGPMICSDAT